MSRPAPCIVLQPARIPAISNTHVVILNMLGLLVVVTVELPCHTFAAGAPAPVIGMGFRAACKAMGSSAGRGDGTSRSGGTVGPNECPKSSESEVHTACVVGLGSSMPAAGFSWATTLILGADHMTLPKMVANATSLASRPVPMRTSPVVGQIPVGSKMYHRPDR